MRKCPARQRAAAELRKDPVRSNYVIAQIAGCSADVVAKARAILVSMYQIGDVPVSLRERRPMPLQPSRTRAAITALPPDATASKVARVAGVSIQAATRMLKVTPRMGDVAAATDAISVLKDNPQPCLECGRPVPPGRRVYCRPECKRAAEDRRQARASAGLGQSLPPAADPAHRPPVIPVLPPPPDWSRGLCTTVKPAQRTWWTSEIRTEREAAALMCADCPVRPDCEQWSLSLPVSDPAVYAGLTPYERRKRRRAWLEAIAAQVRGPR
jgi:hypothetical protein